MSAITVEEFVNKISYRIDTESLKQVIRTTDRLYAHLGKALGGVSGKMDASWRSAMANMAKASRESARSISADAQKATGAWRNGQSGAQGGKGGGMGLLGMAGRLGAGYAAYSVGRYAIQSASDLERMTAQFEVMLGGADKAKTMVESIQKLAASTPLTSMGVTDSVKTLLQFGVAGDKVISTVRMLGDVAGGDQERLNRLAYAYGQTMTAGKLMGQDLLQYINVGFNPLKIMAENLDKFGLKAGTTQSDLRDAMSKGKVSADMVTKAFTMATGAGGMFFQNMDKQSKTLGGLYSTLVDNIQLSLVKAIEPLIPLMKEFVDWIGKIDWAPAVKGIQALAYVLTDFVVPTLKWLKNNWPLVATAMLLVFGPAMLARVVTLFSTIATQAIVAFGTMSASATTAAMASNNAFIGLSNSLRASVSPLLALIALLGVAYYAYQKINEAANQRQTDEENASAIRLATEAQSQLGDLKLERGRLIEQNRMTADWKDERYVRERSNRNKRIAELDVQIKSAQKNSDAYGATNRETLARNNPSDFSTIAQQQLQSINNNSKKVSITQNNDITLQTSVDSKGETPLTPGAVKSIVDTAIRSGINVRLLGVLAEGV